ncbi:tRNA (guanine(10)-N(2))-dimethyltransferase [Candidatus Woesearchaeota archaeon CG_4_10_14_0_2_um_filter_33_10]|nr:MAG: tRNA (guanine(10)-N(2))-dimethyltransferase [Candidatus Woesearchaeota archaeon CG10_big_fil_rev_8_21_14_0_10_33_12]PIU72485.1 MAG: tRNA (guanine(10)-N(2))-dimethyltransferase [Candidatus Woesearchaeota archaeon CG06_land_8_20_14_3_00_33_13]PIZ52898.1 MAG: tRNA (guanine(10)-N(2))-dimethyltransferase [Candidatus Woesearchaeota archaeon CG_4_10_14_0_2_um_filter_33_10]
MEIIQEGKARIKTYTAETVSRDMPVFYNPAMNLNRDINVLLLNSINKKNMQVALPLAATGIRGIRFLLELKKAKVKTISFNDRSIDAFKLIKGNLKLNKIKSGKKIIVTNLDANEFLLSSKGFDYIDIDPFGSPNFFLDSAIKRLARGGILAVTATDTAALCGTSKNACLRKYSSKPLKNEFCHETGLRILISKVQSAGAQYDKALIPVFSYSKEHYFRVFFECEKGKKKADEIIKNYGYILHCKKCLFRENADSIFNDEKCPLCKSKLDYAGKIWLGQLYDKNLADKMNQEAKKSENKELIKLMKIISNESKINEVGFYDLAKVVKHNKLKNVPKKELLIDEIKKQGFKAAETHIRPNSIRSSITIKGLVKIIKKLN